MIMMGRNINQLILNLLNTDTETLELDDNKIFYSGLKFRFIQPKLSKIFSIKKMIEIKYILIC